MAALAVLRGALAAAALYTGSSYETWHVVDIPAVVCPNREVGGTYENLAKSKTVTCEAGMTNCAGVTDGKTTCSGTTAATNADPRIVRYDCKVPAAVTIDLGSTKTFDEVLVFQDHCASTSYCGHKVEVSVDGTTWTTVFTAPTSGFEASAVSTGTSIRFPPQTARHVRFSSGPSDQSPKVFFLEVEVYNGRPPPPPPLFEVAIPMGTQIDPDSPYVLSFIRASQKDTTISYRLADGNNKTINEDTVRLMSTSDPIPSTCKCTGARLSSAADIALYGANYGSSCNNWDEDKCDKFWPDVKVGEWCCKKWCYSDGSCPDSYSSSLISGGFFSYAACSSSTPQPTCKWTQAVKDADPCKCRNVADIMDARMKSLFPSNYGSYCSAWDSLTCNLNYAADQLDNWCCKSWCYVGEECPFAIPSLNKGMEDKLFWADKECTQDALFIAQCPYQKVVNETEENIDLCVCLEETVPTALLPSGASADYGKMCGPHDATKCDVWYPEAKPDMWCCSSWCWVSNACPAKKASKIWPGHYYSSLSCDWDPAAAVDCKWSNACKCANANPGVDTNKFGVNYGKTCGAWDGTNCAGFWNGTAFWGNDTARNDWCCDQWCYVNETCPLVDDSSEISTLKFSYAACNGTSQASTTAEVQTSYAASSNTCVAPASCDCLTSVPAGWQPTAGYGATCAAHDAANGSATCGGRGIDCCRPWCYVSDACNQSVPSPTYPGAFISYQTCESSLDRATLMNCPHSTACQCTNNNTGVDLDRFPATYGKACAAHDKDKCYDWWGPQTGAGLWDTAAGGVDWCCDSWCYVGEECPLRDGMGESVFPYSYRACSDSTEVYDQATKQCKASSARRLSGEAEEEEAEEEGSCDEFFLLDGRAPVELPDTWDEARTAAAEVCEDDGFNAENCDDAVLLAFEGLPEGPAGLQSDDGSADTMCMRLVFLGAAAGASEEAMSALVASSAGAPHVALAASVREALWRRAAPQATDTSAQKRMDEALVEKAAAVAAPGADAPAAALRVLKDTKPLRRLKTTSGGGVTSIASARRRTPSRPVVVSSPAVQRRRAPAAPSPSSALQRRRTQSFTGHRRRAIDVSGKQRRTASGQAFGYTSQPHMLTRFNNKLPSQTPYGYSAAGVYPKQSRKSVAMYAAAGGVAGFAAGAGAYYLYNDYWRGRTFPSWRRRRTSPPSWCLAPPESSVDVMDCSACYTKYGACPSANDCFKEGDAGCGFSTREDYGKDDLMQTGFVPGEHIPPYRVFVLNVTGPDINKAAICPPTTEAQAALALAFNKTTGFSLDLFFTLTQLENLDPSTKGAAGFALPRAALRPWVGLFALAAAMIATDAAR